MKCLNYVLMSWKSSRLTKLFIFSISLMSYFYWFIILSGIYVWKRRKKKKIGSCVNFLLVRKDVLLFKEKNLLNYWVFIYMYIHFLQISTIKYKITQSHIYFCMTWRSDFLQPCYSKPIITKRRVLWISILNTYFFLLVVMECFIYSKVKHL